MKITNANIENVFKSERLSLETAKLKGYELIQELFVDNSGLGSESESALTPNQLINELKNILEKEKSIYAFITQVGQFQIYLGIFKKVKRIAPNAKKISPNTLRIETENGYKIRLYDTDIITVDFKHSIFSLNDGGFNTHTTRERIRKFLPCEGMFYQSKGSWYIQQREKDFLIEQGKEYNFNLC
jgi:hypothetical protein